MPSVNKKLVLKNLSIQSKTTLMLLAVSVTSIVAIAAIGYNSGKSALQRSIFNQLTSLREAKIQELEALNERADQQINILSIDPTLVQAAQGLKTGYRDLSTATIAPQWDAAIRQYYQQKFIPKLAVNVKGEPEAATYEPKQIQDRYLQYYYTIQSDDFDVKAKIDNPQDGSTFSKVHQQFHPFMRDYAEAFGLEDLFLIDPETGNVFYSVYKGVDFGTNLKTGSFSESVLAKAFRKVRTQGDRQFVASIDYEPYRPSYNDPASILATPIYQNGTMIAILAIQRSSKELNDIMTSRAKWKEVGLGQSGETYLVGPDYLMRSDSRFLKEAPKAYFAALKEQGIDDAQIERIQEQDSTILLQEVKTQGAEAALQGQRGTRVITDYRGVSVLSAYAPLTGDLNWALLAEIDEAEAYAPIQEFQKRVLIATVVIIVLITLAAMLMSHLFVRPIRLLNQGFQKFSKGETNVKVTIDSKDEFNELAQSFNEMVQTLNQKTRQLQETSQENEKLLLSILPEPVAHRLKGGEDKIADSFSSVTVLFADLVGFTDLAEAVSADEIVALLNDLVSAFDDAAERHGVEKVKTIGSGYMAVSGLSIPRIDHTKRVVDFAIEMAQIVQRFNQTRQTQLEARIGVNAGPVVAGVIGRSKFIYDLWGDTVNIAHQMQTEGQGNSIQVTTNVYEPLKDFYDFRHHRLESGLHNDELESWILKV
ncbi:MAG: adenylate/guanylate cyclase domain-containing protein [Thermosynechococcaceae cyanobacterium]